METQTSAEAIGLIARTFPGTRVLPTLRLNPDGLAPCVDCLHAFPQAVSTALIDSNGVPWHHECQMRALGLTET